MSPTTTIEAADEERENIIPTAPAPGSARLVSLDVFRGVTVAGMILANNPGSWGAVYPPLKHAPWDGWTPTDLIFPSFLFIVGVSITFALSKRLETGDRRSVLFKVARRTLIILGVGLALAAFPKFDNWRTIRIPGVLARIALCYGAASLIFLFTRARDQVLAALGLLLGYWAMMTLIPVPGFGAGDLARGHDLASYLDRLLLSGHIYKPDYDPEGLLSTLPAIATTLLGVLAGHWLRSKRPGYELDAGLFVAGAAAVVLGSAWGAAFPINKALWTSSFVMLTAGLALVGLATCYWLVDLRGYRRWAYPFRVFGANPLAAFALASIGSRLLNMARVAGADGKPVSLHHWVHDDRLLTLLRPVDASLAYGILFVLACFLVIWLMDALGLHIRA